MAVSGSLPAGRLPVEDPHSSSTDPGTTSLRLLLTMIHREPRDSVVLGGCAMLGQQPRDPGRSRFAGKEAWSKLEGSACVAQNGPTSAGLRGRSRLQQGRLAVSTDCRELGNHLSPRRHPSARPDRIHRGAGHDQGTRVLRLWSEEERAATVACGDPSASASGLCGRTVQGFDGVRLLAFSQEHWR